MCFSVDLSSFILFSIQSVLSIWQPSLFHKDNLDNFFSLSYNLLSLILSSLEFVYWAFKSNDYIFHSKLSNEIVLSHVLVLFLPVFILYLFILLNKYYILHLSLRILKILEYFQNYPINFCFSLDKLTLNMIMTMLAVSLSIKLDFSIYFGILVM